MGWMEFLIFLAAPLREWHSPPPPFVSLGVYTFCGKQVRMRGSGEGKRVSLVIGLCTISSSLGFTVVLDGCDGRNLIDDRWKTSNDGVFRWLVLVSVLVGGVFLQPVRWLLRVKVMLVLTD